MPWLRSWVDEGESDTFDVGADGITITEARGEHVDFSMPYIASQQVLMARHR